VYQRKTTHTSTHRQHYVYRELFTARRRSL